LADVSFSSKPNMARAMTSAISGLLVMTGSSVVA
jgi:hypothetical protein